MKSKLLQINSFLGVLLIGTLLVGCGKVNQTSSDSGSADESASGAAAGAVGGALSGSSSSGTQAFYKMNYENPTHNFWALVGRAMKPQSAYASSFCPTFLSTGSGCSTSGSNMWLTYSDCIFAGAATWNGVQEISKSSGTAACGQFPNPGANGTLYRQFVQSSGSSSPGSVDLTADNWSGVIDDSSANLSNFDNQTISAIHNGGYGAAVSFNSSGARSSITLGHHVYVTGVFDHSVSGSLSISETSGASSRQVSGTVTVYHNRLRVIGTSTFSNIVHEDICCLPVSGTITTAFSAGANVNPTAVGSLMIGKSESLTFNGCGSATYTATDGSVSNVTLHRCF